jgi:hypothetical protein
MAAKRQTFFFLNFKKGDVIGEFKFEALTLNLRRLNF